MAVRSKIDPFAKTDADGEPKKAKKNLMDNQDTAHKGDTGADEKKLVTFQLPASKHAAFKAYCKSEGRTMASMLQQAVNDILKDADEEDF